MKATWFVCFLLCGAVLAETPREMTEPFFKGGEKSVEMKIHEKVYKTTPQGELTLRIYEPAVGGKNRPCAVFFFGGGWKGGSSLQFGKHCEFLASHGYVAITPKYRTERGHGTTPRESVMDAKSCIRWIRAHVDELGIDSDRLVVGGGSAGGHLAAATATVTEINDPADDLLVSCVPNCLVLFNPVVNNGPGEDAYGYDRVADYWKDFSPMHNVDGKKMPPTVIFLGTIDNVIPVSVGEEFVSKVRETGAEAKLFLYEEQGHGFFNYNDGENPFFFESLCDMAGFLKENGCLSE